MMNSIYKELIGLDGKEAASGKEAGAANKRPWTRPELREADYEITASGGSFPGEGASGKGKPTP